MCRTRPTHRADACFGHAAATRLRLALPTGRRCGRSAMNTIRRVLETTFLHRRPRPRRWRWLDRFETKFERGEEVMKISSHNGILARCVIGLTLALVVSLGAASDVAAQQPQRGGVL